MRRPLTAAALAVAIFSAGAPAALAEPGPHPPRPVNSGCHFQADGAATGECARTTNRGRG